MHNATAALDLRTLRAQLRGELIDAEHRGYEQARRVWNGLIDRHPLAVVRALDAADIALTVRYAAAHELPLAVRCGGHSTPGYSTCDDGIVIDLRAMNTVSVDPKARTVTVGGGALWAELDAGTQAHGLAVTGGRMSDTGVGGLTLGSGSGWLERSFGFSCESLLRAQLVSADGELITASADENPDLLWGLRGGGGNFGVVSEFQFALHPVGPLLCAGALMWPRERAGEVICAYREYIAGAPDQVGGGVALITAPSAPFIPNELKGRPVVAVIYCYVGPVADGEREVAPLRALGPAVDAVRPMPYTALQQMLDDGFPRGVREYFKAGWLTELPDAAVKTLLAHGERLPAPFGQLILCPMGAATRRSTTASMALSVPDAPWLYFCLSMWMDPAQDAHNSAFARELASELSRWGAGTAPPNFIAEDEAGRLARSYGKNKYARLAALKRQFDPHNVFALNQNITPASRRFTRAPWRTRTG